MIIPQIAGSKPLLSLPRLFHLSVSGHKSAKKKQSQNISDKHPWDSAVEPQAFSSSNSVHFDCNRDIIWIWTYHSFQDPAQIIDTEVPVPSGSVSYVSCPAQKSPKNAPRVGSCNSRRDINEKLRKRSSLVTCIILQGINISPQNGILKMIFLFPRWDMIISWRVYKLVLGCLSFFPMFFMIKFASTWYAHFFPRDFRHYVGTRPKHFCHDHCNQLWNTMHGYAAAALASYPGSWSMLTNSRSRIKKYDPLPFKRHRSVHSWVQLIFKKIWLTLVRICAINWKHYALRLVLSCFNRFCCKHFCGYPSVSVSMIFTSGAKDSCWKTTSKKRLPAFPSLAEELR